MPHKAAYHQGLRTFYLNYYTINDLNEVDIRIFLPEKVIIHRGH